MFRTIIALLALSMFNYVYSQESSIVGKYYALDPGTDVFIYNDHAEFKQYPDSYKTRIKIEDSDGLTFITFLDEVKFPSYLKKLKYPSRQLWLTTSYESPSMLLIYTSDDSPPFIFNFSSNYFDFNNGVIFSSSSNYREKNRTYFSDNLSITNTSRPWVEDKNGYGIGETIEIVSPQGPSRTLYFSNGFVSFDKPYLYQYNSRVKKISVESSKLKEKIYFDILDTPKIQIFDLTTQCDDLKIVIEDVYPGTKYEDTCINFILLDVRTDLKEKF